MHCARHHTLHRALAPERPSSACGPLPSTFSTSRSLPGKSRFYRRTPERDAEALRLTDGRGADLVLETGGSETFARSLHAGAMAGTVFVIGFLSGARAAIDVLPVIEKGPRIQGNNAGPIADLAAGPPPSPRTDGRQWSTRPSR